MKIISKRKILWKTEQIPFWMTVAKTWIFHFFSYLQLNWNYFWGFFVKKLKCWNLCEIKSVTLSLIWFAPDNHSFWELIYKFYKIWPPFQWATSLITLVLIYWVSGYYYNKFLSNKGGWMDTKTRIWMIIFDLIFNLILGIYYMNHRETFLGALMVKCPVFCSPVFWLLELICFYIYSRWAAGSVLKKKKN